MRTSPIRFSFLLPLGELLIWLILVPVPATLLYLNLRARTQPAGNVSITTEIGTFTMPYPTARRLAIQGPATRWSHQITALNMPGTVVEVLISLPTSWPDLWHPIDMPVDVWRALTLPFFCLPAWWFVGRGIDAVPSGQLRWLAALSGTLLSIACTVLFCGLRFGLSDPERMGESWLLWGLGLWALLFHISHSLDPAIPADPR